MKLKTLVVETRNKYVIGIFVDFKGAFDFLRWEVIVGKLHRIECPVPELKLWEDHFNNRWVIVTNGISTVNKRVKVVLKALYVVQSFGIFA